MGGAGGEWIGVRMIYISRAFFRTGTEVNSLRSKGDDCRDFFFFWK